MPLAIPIPRLVVRSTRLICSSIRAATDPNNVTGAWVLWQIERPGVVIAFG